MSRIGRKPIPIPAAVKIHLHDNAVDVQGPKGKLIILLPAGSPWSRKTRRSMPCASPKSIAHCTACARAGGQRRSGVTEGFKKELDIVGVGYRAEMKGKRCLQPRQFAPHRVSDSRGH